jgi:deoxyribose-phosphate aldolase
MALDSDLDKLVDRIATEVQNRINGQAAPQTQSASQSSYPAPCGKTLGNASCQGCSKRPPQGTLEMIEGGVQRLGSGGESAVCWDVANIIDHTLLAADATKDQLTKMCSEAKEFSFASVCVNSANVRYVSSQLHGSSVMTCAVVGFPLGAMETGAKAFETKQAVRDGANEIDMVINIGALKSRDYAAVENDIRKVVQAAGRVPVKVILETSKLHDEEKAIVSSLSKVAGAAYVKTSTGFGGGGANAHDIALMRRVVGDAMGVKASGGVRNLDDLKNMVNAGANRVGASAGIAIVSGKTSKGGY